MTASSKAEEGQTDRMRKQQLKLYDFKAPFRIDLLLEINTFEKMPRPALSKFPHLHNLLSIIYTKADKTTRVVDV